MQLVNMVCIWRKEVQNYPKILIIQLFNLTVSLTDCGLFHLLSGVSTIEVKQHFIYSRYISKSCFSHCQ